ncbi:MAG TPA: hypothetical protein VKY47_00995, partial [Xanthomarina sp.]|nr:hypothetical protein [Xanthomarina sp.]
MKTIQTTILKSKYVLLALLVAFSFSCSPEDGTDGAPGAIGPAGTNGEDGNANVQSSDWFQIQFDYLNDEDNYGTMLLEIPNIQDFMDNGGVFIMYVKIEVEEHSFIYPLPYDDSYSFVVVNGPGEDIESYVYLNAEHSTVSQIENNPDYTFKYVLIPSNRIGQNKLDSTKMSY